MVTSSAIAEVPPGTILPEIPPPVIITVPVPSAQVTDTTGNGSSGALIGIIVSCVVGGVALIVLAVVVFVMRDRILSKLAIKAWMNREKKPKSAEMRSHAESTQAAVVPAEESGEDEDQPDSSESDKSESSSSSS